MAERCIYDNYGRCARTVQDAWANSHDTYWQYLWAPCAALIVFSVVMRVLSMMVRRAVVIPLLISLIASVYAWHIGLDVYENGRAGAMKSTAVETSHDIWVVVSYAPSAGRAAYGAVRDIMLGR